MEQILIKRLKEFAISSYKSGLDGVNGSGFESKLVKEINLLKSYNLLFWI